MERAASARLASLRRRACAVGDHLPRGIHAQRFRNRDLQKFFFPEATQDLREARRRLAWVSRKLLRAHGIIRKVSGTYRYQLTETGRKAITALLTSVRSTVRELLPEAA